MENKRIIEVENCDTSPKGNELGIGLLLGFLYLTVLPVMVMLVLLMFADIPDPSIWGQDGAYNALSAVAQSIAGALVMIGMYKVSKPMFQKLFKSFNGETFKNSLKFALLAYACILCANMVDVQIFGESMENANQQSVEILLKSSPVLGCFMVIVIAPVVEELIFRYYVFKGLEKRNIYLAYAVTGLAFAGIHLIASIGTPFFLEDLRTLPVYMVGGLVFCYAYHKTQNMAVNIGAHMIYNALATILIFVLPSSNAVEISNVVQTNHSITITVEENAEMSADVKSMEIYLYDEYRPYKEQEPIQRIEMNTETATFDSLSPDTLYIIIINYEMNNNEFGEVGLKQTYIDLYTLK